MLPSATTTTTATASPAACSTRDETELLRRAAKEDHDWTSRGFGRADGEGGTVRLSLWNYPGEGIYGMFARCDRMVALGRRDARRRGVSLPLEDDHEGPAIGGAWTWHQDYGYWYQNGVLLPLS